MATAKIGGSSSPCTNRQKISSLRLPDSGSITPGTSSSTMAATMTRLRPSRSEIAPLNGAVAATASVLAVMIRLAAAAPTPNSWAISGNTACGE